jgi:purine-nucleoside phosphorylase
MTGAIDVIRARLPNAQARIGIVLGSGLGSVDQSVENPQSFPYTELPGFPTSSVSSHKGELILGNIGNVPVAILSGRVHAYETGDSSIMYEPLETLAQLGVDFTILTNAAGSLRKDMPPGSLMAVTDHINMTGRSPLIGIKGDHRFVDMSAAYDTDLRGHLMLEAERQSVTLREGVFMWFMGPSFETPAEIRAARILGADAVGMSIAPETTLCKYLGMDVVAISVITNQGAGMTGLRLSHEETKRIAFAASNRLSRLLISFIKNLQFEDDIELPETPRPWSRI